MYLLEMLSPLLVTDSFYLVENTAGDIIYQKVSYFTEKDRDKVLASLIFFLIFIGKAWSYISI